MREKSNAQTSLFDPQAVDHPVADELERAFAWLDAHPELLEEVAADLGARSGSGRGRRGLSCETVLRCALLKHLRRETYRGLEFILRDSLSAWRFARFEASRLPGKSALQSTIGSIRAETWERINRCLLGAAREEKVEPGDQVRVDSTVTHTHILEPSDSQLLRDGVRVLTRLLAAARAELGADAVAFHDHRRAAKRRALEIGSRRNSRSDTASSMALCSMPARSPSSHPPTSLTASVAAASGTRPAALRRYRDHLHDTDLGSLSTQLALRRIPASIIPAWHMISLREVKNKNAT